MATGIVTIDFGATPTDSATVLVSGLSGLNSNTHLEAWIQSTDVTAGDSDANDHRQLAFAGKCSCEYVSSSSMNINVDLLFDATVGTYKVHYATL